LAVGGETPLGEILKRYWDSLPERVKKLAAEEQELYLAFLALDESLRPYAVPTHIREEDEGDGPRRILVILAASSVVRMALRSNARELRERLGKELSIRVDEIEVYLRPAEEVARIRKRLTGE